MELDAPCLVGEILKLEAMIEEDASRGNLFNILTQLWEHNLYKSTM